MGDFEEKTEIVIDTITVKPLHFLADRRRDFTVIVDKKGKEAWLLPTKEVPGNFEFTLTVTELATLPQPYNFEEELKAILPTVKDVQKALWLKGIVTLDDLENYDNVKNALASVLPSATALRKGR